MAVSWLSDLFKRRCICKLGRTLGYIGICHADTVIKLRKKVFFLLQTRLSSKLSENITTIIIFWIF